MTTLTAKDRNRASDGLVSGSVRSLVRFFVRCHRLRLLLFLLLHLLALPALLAADIDVVLLVPSLLRLRL